MKVPTKHVAAVTAYLAYLDSQEAAVVVTPKAKKAAKKGKKQPKSLVAAKSHCYEARMARRSDPARKGGAGMTKAEKSALYAELTAKYGQAPTTRQWNAACAKARGLK